METRLTIMSQCCKTIILKGLSVVIFTCCFFYVFQYYAIPAAHKMMIGWAPVSNQVMNGSTPVSHQRREEDGTCDRVLKEARLSNSTNPWFQIDGCTLHKYSQNEGQSCMRRIASIHGINSIALVGDSRIRNLFVSLTQFFGKSKWSITTPMRHSDFLYYNDSIYTVVYYQFRGELDSRVFNDYENWLNLPVILRPRVIILGHCLWDLTYGGTFEKSSANFKANLRKTIPHMERMTSSTDILWMVQDPTDPRKLSAADVKLRGPDKVQAYNNFTLDMLSNSSVKIWGSSREVALRFPNDNDGIHYGPDVMLYKVQLFLNWYCNRHMNLTKGTCCS